VGKRKIEMEMKSEKLRKDKNSIQYGSDKPKQKTVE